MKRRYFLLTFLIACNIQAETLDLDLNTARELALNNNPSLKLAREGVQKSQAKIKEARSNFMPILSGFYQFQHAWELPTYIFNFSGNVVKVKAGQENTMAYGFNLSHPVYAGGMIRNAYQMSIIGANITESQLKTIEQKILSEVTSAYYGVLFASSASEVADEGLRSAEQNLAQVQKFFDVGKSSRFDVLRAEVQVANFKPMVVSANNARRLAESALRVTLGVSDDTDINYIEKLHYTESGLIKKTLDELIGIALLSRPEMSMLSDQIKLSKKQVSLAKANYLPSLIVGTSYQYQGQRDDFKFVNDDFYKSFNSSVSLSVPIFSGFGTSAKVQQAKIAVKETGYQAESAINGIKLEVKSAFFIAKEADENVITQAKTISLAEEALRLAELMYSEGSSTQLDVLNANVALNQAKMNYQESLYKYNVALANLKKAINQL
ncbi:MAG: TolC family protein [Candidatus Neomarinimicrobiota bacterium]